MWIASIPILVLSGFLFLQGLAFIRFSTKEKDFADGSMYLMGAVVCLMFSACSAMWAVSVWRTI